MSLYLAFDGRKHLGYVEANSKIEAGYKAISKWPNRATTVRKANIKNPILSLDGWIPCHAIRRTRSGKIQVLREKNPNPSKVSRFIKLVKATKRSKRRKKR